MSQWNQTQTPEDSRGILAIMAIAKNLRRHTKFLFNFSDDELLEMEATM